MTWSIARYAVALAIGSAGCWLAVNLSEGPGVAITDQAEAEGPQFASPSTLDLVSRVSRRRVCPSQTQRWAWRWTTYRGERAHQAVPLRSTAMPFLAEDGVFILTLPSTEVPDPATGNWFYRSVTAEQCGFLPTWFSGLFGPRVLRSPDLPVNFVGEAHASKETQP